MGDREFFDAIAKRKLVRPIWEDMDVQGMMKPLHLQTFPRGRGQGVPISVDVNLQSSRLIEEEQTSHMRLNDKIAPQRKC